MNKKTKTERELFLEKSLWTFYTQHGIKLGMVVHVCNPRFWEIEAGAEVQSHSLLHSEFQASLSYIR